MESMKIRETVKEKTRKYNYVYKLYLKSDERYYYIGKRSTDKEDDSDYLGSGKGLDEYRKKYGKDCFRKEILSYWETAQKALEEEARLVTEDVVRDPFCLNRMKGGGAFDTLGCKWRKRTAEEIEKVSSKLRGKKQSEETKKKRAEAIRKKWEDAEYSENQKKGRAGKYDKHLEKISKEREGKICITKDSKWKYIEKEFLADFKSDGWQTRGVENKPSREELEEYRKNGFTFSEIGKLYGITESGVRNWFRRRLL